MRAIALCIAAFALPFPRQFQNRTSAMSIKLRTGRGAGSHVLSTSLRERSLFTQRATGRSPIFASPLDLMAAQGRVEGELLEDIQLR